MISDERASTFVAMDAPEKIGLIPGVLQHASPDVSDQRYDLARSMQAGHRFAAHLSEARIKLRSVSIIEEGDHARCHLRPVQYRPSKRVEHR